MKSPTILLPRVLSRFSVFFFSWDHIFEHKQISWLQQERLSVPVSQEAGSASPWGHACPLACAKTRVSGRRAGLWRLHLSCLGLLWLPAGWYYPHLSLYPLATNSLLINPQNILYSAAPTGLWLPMAQAWVSLLPTWWGPSRMHIRDAPDRTSVLARAGFGSEILSIWFAFLAPVR